MNIEIKNVNIAPINTILELYLFDNRIVKKGLDIINKILINKFKLIFIFTFFILILLY